MVKNPELVVPAWLEAGAQRIIVHVEAMNDAEIITDACRERGAEAMLAASPETPVEKLIEYKNEFAEFQILAVSPGKAGQQFNTAATEKIRTLRTKIPRAIIEVDGGINAETAELAKEVGANVIVSASYILDSVNPRRAFELLAAL